MSKFRFSINLKWPAESEGIDRLGQRIVNTTNALPAIDPMLRSWWFVDLVKKAYVPVDEIRSTMTPAIEQGVVKDDFGEPEPSSGYMMGLVNEEKKTSRTLELDMHGGGNSSSLLSGGIELSSPIGTVPDPAIIRYSFVKAMVMTLVPIWAPVCGSVFMPEEDRGTWRKSDRLFKPQWMTYLCAEMAARIVPPEGIVAERTADGGLLLIATEETYDYENPEHTTGALAISDALAGFSYRKAMWPHTYGRLLSP